MVSADLDLAVLAWKSPYDPCNSTKWFLLITPLQTFMSINGQDRSFPTAFPVFSPQCLCAHVNKSWSASSGALHLSARSKLVIL